MIGKRNTDGAIMPIAVTLAIILAVLVVAFFQLEMQLGGSKEVRNAVDAGALNTGKKLFSLKVAAQGAEEMKFLDVADSSQQFGLANINRVLARAFLVRLNAKAMDDEGTGTALSRSNANSMTDAALALAGRLADRLNDQGQLHPFFDDIATRNSVRMLGKASVIQHKPGPEWATSLLDRQQESNIEIQANQLPGSISMNDVKAVQAKDNKFYLAGYNAVNILNRDLAFVPFKVSEKTHLVSGAAFEANMRQQAPFPQWANPVPNAFSCFGATQGQDREAQTARSFVIANPQRSFPAAIPRGFVRINFNSNEINWNINGIPTGSTSYDFFPSVESRGPIPAGIGTITAYASVGNEYIPPTLYKGIFAIPGTGYGEVKNRILQRCRQIKPGLTEGELDATLMACPLIPGIKQYVIFVGPGNTLMATPKDGAMAFSPMMNPNNNPDGSSKELVEEDGFMFPNPCWFVLSGPGPKPGPFWSDYDGSLKWTPGSGENDCLGELRIDRDTDVYVTGVNSVL